MSGQNQNVLLSLYRRTHFLSHFTAKVHHLGISVFVFQNVTSEKADEPLRIPVPINEARSSYSVALYLRY